MNILEREQEKLKLLQCEDLLLLPNTISITDTPNSCPTSPHRILLSLNYAEAELKAIITFSVPLDCNILTPDLLPPSILDETEPPLDTSLLGVARWLLETHGKHQETVQLADTCLSNLPKDLDHLKEIYPSISHELVVRHGKVTILVKLPYDRYLDLSSINLLLESARLTKTGGHYCVLKLVYKTESDDYMTGESFVMYSPELVCMLPELKEISLPDLKEHSFSEVVTSVLGHLETELEEAVVAWKARANLLLSILVDFQGREGMNCSIDYDTMTSVDLVFRSEDTYHLLIIKLETDHKLMEGSIEYRYREKLPGSKLSTGQVIHKIRQDDIGKLGDVIDEWVVEILKQQ